VEINFTSSSVLELVIAAGDEFVGTNDEIVGLVELGGGDDNDEGGIEIETGSEVAPEVGAKVGESL